MRSVLIGNAQLTARIIEHGASLADLRLSGFDAPLILGLDDPESYAQSDLYFGAVIGRHANRIGGAHAVLGGVELPLAANDGPHHLHGGPTGFARRWWSIVSAEPDSVRLRLISEDGDEGYPGRLVVNARYRILAPATLQLTLEAVTDRPTLVNLCHHPYFNLAGSGEILDHRLTIAADRYLPSGPDLVPTGDVADVAGTRFDFREPRRLGAVERRAEEVFNHNYCLADAPRDAPAFAARLVAPGGVEMELWSTQTGLHFYEGYKIAAAAGGIGGRRYDARHGLCLEAQNWPDSPNHPHFPSAVLSPPGQYRQVTEYRFQRGV